MKVPLDALGVWAAVAAIPVSVLAAILSAWFASHAVTESKRQSAIANNAVTEAKVQNDIALFEKRVDIYHGLLKFNRAAVYPMRPDYSKDELIEFATPAMLSEFYFPAEIHSQFVQILEDAHANRGLLPPDTDEPDTPQEHFVERIDHGAFMEHKKLAMKCRVLQEEVRLHLVKLVKQRS